MTHPGIRRLAWAILLMSASSARSQTTGSRVPGGATGGDAPSTAPSPGPGPAPEGSSADSSASRTPPGAAGLGPREWFRRPFSQAEDPDGPINTDRPTFTPANTVVTKGRVQFESGFTYNRTRAGSTRGDIDDFPELAVRIGIFDRVEIRTFWQGQTYARSQSRPVGRLPIVAGGSDMEVGFKWQLFAGDPKRKWIPTTALITSIMAPTGGNSPYSSQTVDPYINLIYGWSVTEKLSLGGSTGFLGMRQRAASGSGLKADSFERYQQSLVAFYTATRRATLFYEWYAFTFTNASDNRPAYFMDGGLLYRLSPSIQLDLRGGFGLTGRPDDFFTGAGFSIRF